VEEGSDVSSERDSHESYEDPAEAFHNQIASRTCRITYPSNIDGDDTSGSNDTLEFLDTNHRNNRLVAQSYRSSSDRRASSSSGSTKLNSGQVNMKRKKDSSEKDGTDQRKKGRFELTSNKGQPCSHPLG
jgi:hypothetical protein